MGTAARPRVGADVARAPAAKPRRVVYWIPAEQALVVGDVLLGAGAKPRATDEPLRLCPARWVAPATLDDLKASLRPLLGDGSVRAG